VSRIRNKTPEQVDRQLTEDLHQLAQQLVRVASRYATGAAVRRMNSTDPAQRFLEPRELQALAADLDAVKIGVSEARLALFYAWLERHSGVATADAFERATALAREERLG
jgi:hypothetical protein